MTSRTTNRFSPEVRTRAVRMVLDHEGEHASRWAAVVSIAAKIGCTPQTLNEWVKRTDVDSGRKPGLATDMAAKMKAMPRTERWSKVGEVVSTAPTARRAGTIYPRASVCKVGSNWMAAIPATARNHR